MQKFIDCFNSCIKSDGCNKHHIPYDQPKCLCFYDKYGVLCRPGCKRRMVIKKWRTYLPVIPSCTELESQGVPIYCI